VNGRRRTIKKRLMKLFPKLRASHFKITSGSTAAYNCIAFAAGINNKWWEYRPGYAWPNATRNSSVDAAIELFAAQGFEKCETDRLEAGWEKIAIYGDRDGYTHAARQLASGRWVSKLGKLHDIEHKQLEDLTDGDYGEVKQIMKRFRGLGP
jgi:hypothetical protein